MGTIILNSSELSNEVRILLFGVCFPMARFGLHYLMGHVMTSVTRHSHFDEEKTKDLFSLVNMMVEVACNLSQMV